jgi:shikimate O-hydroxycinnamoyltransferase
MGTLEVDIISKENIKPSFPTPSHLQTYKLSLLDQLIPSPYASIILFYPNNDHCDDLSNIPKRLELLKKSLSETLTQFYPLAGKIKGDLYIECNDEGVCFAEAHVSGSCLSEFLSHPDPLLTHKFLPREFVWKESCAVSNIQVGKSLLIQ